MTGLLKQTSKTCTTPNSDVIGLFNNGVLMANGELRKICTNLCYFNLPASIYHVGGDCINSVSRISLMFCLFLVDTSYASHIPVSIHIDFWHRMLTFYINRQEVGEFLHKDDCNS